MPQAVAESVNEGVTYRHMDCSGGRIRFVTDSPYVVLKWTGQAVKGSYQAQSGIFGFDMYAELHGENRYVGTFIPPVDAMEGYENVVDFIGSGERMVTIEMPLYSYVYKVYIGLKKGCSLKKAPDYPIEKPVIFYGSSITQGGCASKPSSNYPSIISRKFNCNYINLGFSGSARGEDVMADYINSLDMSLFVYDYDHNAPTTERLRETHKRMFDRIREVHPDIPIIIMPRPKYYLTEEEQTRYDIIYHTCLAAKESGDENVYFINNKKLMTLVEDNGLVDGCHPTDSGFLSMAAAVIEVIEKYGLLGGSRKEEGRFFEFLKRCME